MLIKVDPNIPYLEMVESANFSYGTLESRHRIASERHEVYYFADLGRNNIIKRFFIIVVSRLVDQDWYYIDNFDNWWENPLHSGNTEFGHKTYKTASVVGSIKGGDFAKYFNSKSYFLSNCYAMKVLHRLVNESNKLVFWYGEDCGKLSQNLEIDGSNVKQKNSAIRQAIDALFEQAIVFQD